MSTHLNAVPSDDDDGSADPRLVAALAGGHRAEVLAALADARVFAPVSATSTAEHTTDSGLRAESTAEMAVLLLEADGRRALPVFLAVGDVRRWRLEARPVRLTGPQACLAAQEDGAEAVVLDPDGAAFVLAGAEVASLAQGWVPVTGTGLSTRRADTALVAPDTVPPGLVAALEAALRPERLRTARLLQGPDGLVLGVAPARPLPPEDLAALAHRVMTRLGASLPVEGLDLTQVAARGPGVPVVRRALLPRRGAGRLRPGR
jgi:hypothetical protein